MNTILADIRQRREAAAAKKHRRLCEFARRAADGEAIPKKEQTELEALIDEFGEDRFAADVRIVENYRATEALAAEVPERRAAHDAAGQALVALKEKRKAMEREFRAKEIDARVAFDASARKLSEATKAEQTLPELRQSRPDLFGSDDNDAANVADDGDGSAVVDDAAEVSGSFSKK